MYVKDFHLNLVAFLLLSLLAAPVLAQEQRPGPGYGMPYETATKGTRYLEFANGASFKILLEQANLGGRELELAEHSFAPGTHIGSHPHGSIEIFYVLSGELEHTVNGRTTLLMPGMVGVVRPGDQVIHRVPSENTPAKVLIIWAPGGEVDRIFRNATERPIEAGPGGQN